nr:hypothetical protein [Verrucomicrobiota bacterium]
MSTLSEIENGGFVHRHETGNKSASNQPPPPLMKKLRLLALAATLALTAASSLHAQTILNGSFENPALAPGGQANGSGDNWTTTGGGFVETNGGPFGTTPFGNQWEALNPAATDAQTLTGTFTLGSTYTLSL